MVKKNIYIVDKLVIGYNHIIFNSSVTSIIANVYKHDTVTFVAEAVHSGVVAEKNQLIANLEYRTFAENPIPLNITSKIIPYFKKKSSDLFFIKRLFATAFNKETKAVFFTCLSTTMLLYSTYKARKAKIPFFFFLHGEIEYIFMNNPGVVKRLKGEVYKHLLRRLGPTSKVIVLSDIVKSSLISAGYLSEDKIITIEHPIIPVNIIEKKLSDKKTIFGHIGVALTKKSSELFFNLPQSHKKSIENGTAVFQLIGKVDYGLELSAGNGIEILSENNQSITQERYEQAIANIDYAIFTFTGDNYVYRTSGSVMDAIAFAKPIIALKHDFFTYLFETSGNIGFLCNNLDELNMLINNIVEKEESLINQYETQQENLKKLRKTLSLEDIKIKLSNSISKN